MISNEFVRFRQISRDFERYFVRDFETDFERDFEGDCERYFERNLREITDGELWSTKMIMEHHFDFTGNNNAGDD